MAVARRTRLGAALAALVAATGCVAPDVEHVKVPDSTVAATASALPTVAGVTTTDPLTGEAPTPDAASRIVAFSPARVYDSGDSPPNCGGSLAVGAHDITLPADVTPKGVTAVVVNVVVSDAAGPGEVRVWAHGAAPPTHPTASVAGTCDATVKLAIVPVGADHTISISTSVAARVAVVSVGALVASPLGAAAGRLVPLAPTRVLDTSASLGASGPLPSDAEVELTIGGTAGVPVGQAAVVLQLTATDGKPPGVVRAWAAGADQPDLPLLALPSAGWAASNLAIVPLSAQGKITLRPSAETNLVADVVGFVTGPGAPEVSTGLVVPGGPTPAAVADTATAGGPLEPGFRRDVTATGAPEGAGAMLVSTIAPHPTDAGAITVYPGGAPRPDTPTVPVQGAGLTSVSPALVRLGAGNRFSLTTEVSTDLSLDALAWVLGTPVPADPNVPSVAPDTIGTPPNTAFDSVIDGFLTNRGLKGASVTVAKDGRVVYARGYGSTDDTGAPVRVDTRFRFASISKVITAAAVLQLVQAGALSLDDNIFSLLSDRLPFADNPDPRIVKITVRDLLHHTSGFTKATDPFFTEQPQVVKVFGAGGPKTCLDAAKWFITLPLASTPGSQFAYVNMNYCLLSLLVEKITNESYDTVVQSLVLERRNVRDARIGTSFSRKPDEIAYPAAGGTFLESLAGAGGWLGTSVDLVRFIDGLDPSKPGQHLLKPETYAQLTQPGPGSWGLGVEVFPDGSWGHTGSLAGARAMAMHRPDGITWSVVVNGTFENHNVVLRDLMSRALATTTDWPTIDYSPELP